MDFNQPPYEPEPAFLSWEWWRAHPQTSYGFIGWYVINGLLYLIPRITSFFMFLFFTNILVILTLILTKETRYVGLGTIIALALNFLVSLILGVFFNGVCFVPFYVKLF